MQNIPENQIQSLTNRGLSARSSCCVGIRMGSGAIFLPKGELSHSSALCQDRKGHCFKQGYKNLKLCQRGNALGRV